MEIYIFLGTMVISILSVIVSVAIYMRGISRECKHVTLDALGVNTGI